MEGGSKGAERYSASSQRKHAEDESATRQEPRSAADATNRLQRPGPPTTRICGHATIRPRIARVKRSEEHTSELQSLMRISYAVFCLKKKKKTPHTNHTHHKSTTKIQD